MSPKRGDRVAPPADSDSWDVRFATNEAVKGWETLCQQAPANTLSAWNTMRNRLDNPPPTPRRHPLKGSLATAVHGGATMDQWQIEVTGAGRIWYRVDSDRRVIWLKAASVGHPKATE